MTNPDDRRTPQERAYDPRETDPDQPTEHIDQPTQQYAQPNQQYAQPTQQFDQPTQQFAGQPEFSTSDPNLAYGQAYAYPPPQQYQNATQAFPVYEDGSPYGGAPPYGPPPYDTPPQTPEEVLPPEDEKKGGLGKWVALAAVSLLLIAVVLGGISLLGSGGDDSRTAAPATSTQRSAPPTTTAPETEDPESTPEVPPLEQIPGGIGEAIGGVGAAVGTIGTNDGGTLTLEAIGGSTVTVTTTPETRVIGLSGSNVADLKPGDTVMVQGSKVENGAMTADMIVNTSLSGLGGN